MKKITLLTALSIFCLTATAQNKFGNINAQEIMMLMPEVNEMQEKLMQKEQQLNSQLQALMGEYQQKEQDFLSNQDSYDELVKQDKRTELQGLASRIQKFENDASQVLQKESNELLGPIEQKFTDAVNEVAKEEGYTYIFRSEIILYGQTTNDIGALVKKKLGL